MSDIDIHSCGYYCERPACIVAQRNELRDKLFEGQAVKTYSGGKPNYTQPIEQEPVAHLWECLSRWSAMLANDGEHADLSPPSWLCDAIEEATAPLKKEWVGLTEDEAQYLFRLCLGRTYDNFWQAIEAKLKEKNT
jgi:hypothetical protein